MEIIGKYNKATLYTERIDEESLTQLYTMLNNPAFEKGHIAVMPDVHIGKGSVVGFTMELNQYVSPQVVGVDIGCGIDAYQLGKMTVDLEALDHFIRRSLPHGKQVNPSVNKKLKLPDGLEALIDKIDGRQYSRVLQSIGSLGGGNHFIELEVDSDENLWLVIHSGSRNLGLMTAYYHQDRAKAYMKQLFSGAGAYHGLEYLNLDHNGLEYIHDMKIVQEYAALNRREMARKIAEEHLSLRFNALERITSVHNYISFEDNIIRKGAIAAQKDQWVIIPMNMRDGSLLAKGKGNPAWNYSAPHGAGRLLSRSAAKEQLSLEAFQESMEGVYSTSVCKDTLDESPMVYKPMAEIIAMIGDTVEVTEIMKPVYNFKSTEQ